MTFEEVDCLAPFTRTLGQALGLSWTVTESEETITGDIKEKERKETDCCSHLTFGTVVLLFGTLASLPPPPLQYFQSVILLQLEDGQRDLISERRPWQMTNGIKSAGRGQTQVRPKEPETRPDGLIGEKGERRKYMK